MMKGIDSDASMINVFSRYKEDPRRHQEIMAKPKSRKNYAVCFTARSGSTMLCSLLTQSRALGVPAEFLNPRGPMQKFLAENPASSLEQLFDYLRREKTTPNGVFGFKVVYQDFKPVIDQQLVERLLSPMQYLYLTRKDLVLQAISLYRAISSNQWHRFRNNVQKKLVEPRKVVFDEKKILCQLDILQKDQLQWEQFFRENSISALRLTYESLLDDIQDVLARIFNFLDVQADCSVDLGSSSTEKLGDDTSLEWASRIRKKYPAMTTL